MRGAIAPLDNTKIYVGTKSKGMCEKYFSSSRSSVGSSGLQKELLSLNGLFWYEGQVRIITSHRVLATRPRKLNSYG